MSRRTTAWSTTSYRDGTDGYVPGANDGVINYANDTAYVQRSDPFVQYSNNTGYVADSTSSNFPSFPSNSYPSNTYPAPNCPPYNQFTHTSTAFAGTSMRDSTFNPPQHNSSFSNIGRNIYDTLNSTFGSKHTETTFSGTSTRSSFPDDNNFGPGTGTSFR